MGAACGGDDDDSSADAPASTSDESGDDSSADAPASTSDESGDDGGSDSGSEWCNLARSLDAEDAQLDAIDFGDADALEAALTTMIDLFEDAAGSAPDEIKDDVELVLDRTKEAVDALEEADWNFLDVDQTVFDDPEADAANERIDAYNASVCGIDNGSGGTIAPDDNGDAGDTSDTSGTGELGGTVREQLVTEFQTMGMTEEQANCLVDNLDLSELTSSDASDPSAFLDLFETCDIDLTQLTPGG